MDMYPHPFSCQPFHANKCRNNIYIATKIMIKVTNELQNCGFTCVKWVKRRWTPSVLSSGGALMSQECILRKTFTFPLHGRQVDKGSEQLECLWTWNCFTVESQQLSRVKAPGFTSFSAHLRHSKTSKSNPKISCQLFFYFNLTFFFGTFYF